jgi:hypothetical protein
VAIFQPPASWPKAAASGSAVSASTKHWDEPLAGVQIETLRIIDNSTWFAAQERLGKLTLGAGRPPADGVRQSRPRVVNGLIACWKHNSPLHVHGPDGKYLSCKACRDAPEPDLYSLLHRRLSLDLICDRSADAISFDGPLVEQALEAFRGYVESLTRPDLGQADGVQREIERLSRQISFILDAPGDTEEDQKENRDRLLKLRSERAAKQKLLAEIEEAARAPSALPGPAEVLAQVQQIKATLREAAHSDDPAELAALRDLIKDLTGGQIFASQQGERARGKGWVRLTFQINALGLLGHRCGFPEVQGEAITVEIDVKEPDWKDQKCEEVKELYDKEILEKDIADQLHLHRSQVSMLLDHWSIKHGQPLPDGRKRRPTLARKQQKTPDYKAIADDVKALWDDPAYLSVLEIARRLSTTDTMVWKALAWWYRSRGLTVPTAKERRERIMIRAKAMFDADMEIKDIAAVLGYTTRGMKLLLKEIFSRNGEVMPDCRARRHHCKKAS